MKRKLISLLMAAAMTFMLAAVVPENGGYEPIEGLTITAKAAGATIEDEMKKFPHFKFWNHVGSSYNNPDGYTSTPCTHHGSCSYTGTCGCNSYDKAIQCYGFALKVANDIYGQNARNWTKDKNVNNLKAGDICRINGDTGNGNNGHSLIIIKVSGNNVTYGDCNGTGKFVNGVETSTPERGCRINWKHTTTKSALKNKMYGAGDGVSHAPYEAPYSSTPTGHIMTESEAAGRTIPNGDYFIVSGLARNYFLDVAGDGKASADNTNITMKISDDGTLPNGCDVFTFEYLNNGFYKIYQKDTKKCLDAYGGTTNSGVNVAVWDDNGTNAQQWSIEYTSYGYKLRSRCSSYYIDVNGAAVANGTNVWIWAGNDTAAQKFGFIPYTDKPVLADGTYRIQYDYNKDYYLGAAGSTDSHTSGDGLQIFSNKAEEFVFEYVGGGCYSIKEKNSSLALDLNNGTAENYLKDFTSIALYEYHGGRNQLWYVSKSASGTYFIYNKMGGFLLDVKGGQPSEGCEVAQYHYNGSGSQQWNLIRTELAGDANEDGTVSVKDVTLLSQYLAKWNVKLNKTNANVNADFRLTVADVTMIKQYLANWNVTLKTGMVIDEIEGVVVTIDV